MIALGATVEWTSSSNGSTKKKTGRVVQVVPPGEYPDREKFKKLYSGSGVGFCRDHESYVVSVDAGKTTGSSVRYYWPRVKALQQSNG